MAVTKEAPELLACPFCGSSARWATTTEEDDWEIQCSNEECPVIFIGGGKVTGEELQKAWNARAALAQTGGKKP